MIIELKDVRKKYKDFELNCSLNLEPGRVSGLIGCNGAGKSTTFKAILNLISTDGDVKVFGKDVSKLSQVDKQKIGVVLSDSGFSGYLSVNDIIPIMSHLYSSFERDDFSRKCNEFSIPLDKKIKEFSTGMMAKLKILCALSHKAKLLVLDEPTAGLDVIARDELLNMLRNYMEQDEENSILISSHISADLEGLCDDIYMINDGRIILHEDTDVILSDYAELKLTDLQYKEIDKKYIIRHKKETFGYVCLTNRKLFYKKNYPEINIEKGSIDEVISLMICKNGGKL